MDSFYEQPRTAPVPTSRDKIPLAPVVPEVSMIFQNNSKENSSDSMYLTYNTWKARNQCKGNSIIKNNPQRVQSNNQPDWLNSQSFSKQVRFESPVNSLQPQVLPSHLDHLSRNDDISQTNHLFLQTNMKNKRKENDGNVHSNPGKCVRPFEQIYMANIPNRNLDLSIIDHRNVVGLKENLENVDPNTNFGKWNAHTTDSTKNYLQDSNRISKISDIIATTDQYPHKLDCIEIKNKAPDYDFQKVSKTINDPFEKNPIIDLYNYKRENLGTASALPGYHYSLDNTEVANTKNAENHLKKSNPRGCMYDSFDSHCCENSKHKCSSINNMQLPEIVKNNAEIQTVMESVQSNSLGISNNVVAQKNSDEPSVKDLLRIIHQQNDQLLVLQKQVATLLSSREVPKQIESQPFPNANVNIFGEKCRTSTQLESQGLYSPLQNCHPRNGPLPQFSLDVMTSFEVSIRRQQNLNRAYKEVMNQQPKICEVSETDSNAFDIPHNLKNNRGYLNGVQGSKTPDNTEVSLTLNEPVHVPETCPSPVNTIQIDMEDYSSDDEEDNSDEQWFYKNVKGQVNQILRKSGIWPDNYPLSSPQEDSKDILTCSIRKKVKEATVKHLKSIGVHVPAVDESADVIGSETSPNVRYNPNDISFVVKQLLMKYLPNEQLAKLAHIQTQKVVPQQTVEQAGLIKRRPEFSFATVQYMQKYNLLTDNNRVNQQPQTVPVTRQDDNFDRILDITAIRQQPKLL